MDILTLIDMYSTCDVVIYCDRSGGALFDSHPNVCLWPLAFNYGGSYTAWRYRIWCGVLLHFGASGLVVFCASCICLASLPKLSLVIAEPGLQIGVSER